MIAYARQSRPLLVIIKTTYDGARCHGLLQYEISRNLKSRVETKMCVFCQYYFFLLGQKRRCETVHRTMSSFMPSRAEILYQDNKLTEMLIMVFIFNHLYDNDLELITRPQLTYTIMQKYIALFCLNEIYF